MSTYNPQAKWDWYEIGGRWQGRLKIREAALAVAGQPGVFDNPPALAGGMDIARAGDIENLSEMDCFALLTPEGWEAQAKMGWWAVTYERTQSEEDWDAHVREVLAGLPPDAVIAMVDCHI